LSITTIRARLDKLMAATPGHVITELVMLAPDEAPPPGSVPLGPDAWLMPDLAPQKAES